MMKKILLIFFAIMLLNNPVYGQDDDSVPYMPYPVQPQQEAPKAPPKTTKKTQTKKTVKKSAPKKTVKKSVKKSVPKSSSLQKGIELINQGRYEQAKPYLLKAIQENRNDPNVWYWYGVWHEKTGGFYQAQYFYSKAITIDPAFEPLSRVVYYPNDSEKTPLWDPKRPARVYPVETSSKGVTTIPPNAQDRRNFPSAPNDPEIPKVPVYIPPEPGANPLEGDSWAPSIYVPPSREEIQTEGEMSPIYTPPQPQSIVAENRTQIEVPMYNNIEIVNNEVVNEADRDRIIRADLPLYNPPEPGQQRKIVQAPKVEQPKQSVQPAKKQTVQKKQQVTIPTSRVVKQTDKKISTKKVQPAPKPQPKKTVKKQNQTVSRDVKPSTPKQPQTKRSEPVKPAQPEVIQEEKQQRQQTEYLPPVGQYLPDPGTVPDTPIPPVGQGRQY